MKHTKILKAVVILLTIAIFASVFAGCGFAGSGSTDSKTKNLHFNTVKGWTNDNKLVIKTKDGIAGVNGAYNTVNGHNGIWTETLSCANEYGLHADNNPMKFFREIAITMYESVFNDCYGCSSCSQHQKIAGTYRDKDEFVTDGSSLGKLMLTPVTLIKGVNEITQEYFGTNYVEKINDDVGKNTGLHEVIKMIQSTACAVLLVIWSMGFISQVVNEKFSMETLLKSLMQLLLGIVLVLNSEQFVSAFAQMGNAIIEKFQDPGGDTFKAFKDEMLTTLRNNILAINMGFDLGIVRFGIGTIWIDVGSLMVILHLIFPLIALVICAYKIVSMMIMRMLELIVRITLAPIPLAFGAQQGFSQDAIRYFRGIGACALQPVLMLIGAICIGAIANSIMKIFGTSATAATVTGIPAVIAVTLSYFILNAYMGQTKQMAQEIVAR